MNELIESPQHSPLALYEAAVLALTKASNLAETMAVRDATEFLKLQAKLAGDNEAIARAVDLRFRAERKVGAMLIDLKDRGELTAGGRPWKNGIPGAGISLKDVGIDKKLSASSQKLAKFDLDEFETVIGRSLEKIRSGGAVVVNPGKDLSTEDKKLRRQVKAAQLALKQSKLPDDIFGVILADPEWPDETWSENGRDRSPEYPLSSIEEIAARPVGKMAAGDAVLGLWITMRHLAIGSHLAILKEWGFEAKTVMIWNKVVPGTGKWVRNQVEALVIATRGKVPCPAQGTQWPDLISVPKSPVHSRKPDFAHEWFEEFFPDFKKIELNARRSRPGWTLWGNEAPEGSSSHDDDLAVDRGEVSTSLAGAEDDADRQPIRQDEPADVAGRSLPPSHPQSVAVEPETGTGQSGAEGGGRGEPSSDVPPEPLSVDEQNAIIRQGYSHVPITPIAELMKLTGLTKDQIKKRAQKLAIASRDNQKGAVRVLMTKINEDRRAGA